LAQDLLMGAMASFERRLAVRVSKGITRQTFPAVIAFLAQADAGRSGNFHGDLPAGPMAQDDSRQGGGSGENQVESGR
jgi:hypothetical protein